MTPNSAGNVTLNIPQGTVTSINNVTPNAAGRVTLAPVNITGAGQVVLVSAVRKHITFGDWYYYIPAGGSWYAYTYRQTGSQQGNNNVSRPVYGWLWSVRAGGSAVQCPTAPPDSTYAICIRIS